MSESGHFDSEKVPTLKELEETIWDAREAKEQGQDNWQQTWFEALGLLSNYLAPWAVRPEPLRDRLDAASKLILITIELLQDERNGAAAHFWQAPQNRPPKTDLGWTILRAVVVLVAACRERERRSGAGRDAYEVAQSELRQRGKQVERNRLRSMVSNASRMPDEQKGAAEMGFDALKSDTFDPNVLIEICADFIARHKAPL